MSQPEWSRAKGRAYWRWALRDMLVFVLFTALVLVGGIFVAPMLESKWERGLMGGSLVALLALADRRWPSRKDFDASYDASVEDTETD